MKIWKWAWNIGTVIALASVVASAQKRDYVALDTSDAQRAQEAYDTMKKAEAEWTRVQKTVQEKYVPKSKTGDSDSFCSSFAIVGNEEGGSSSCVPRVWSSGFEFSRDFKMIFPKDTTVGVLTVGGTPCPYWGVTSSPEFNTLTTRPSPCDRSAKIVSCDSATINGQ